MESLTDEDILHPVVQDTKVTLFLAGTMSSPPCPGSIRIFLLPTHRQPPTSKQIADGILCPRHRRLNLMLILYRSKFSFPADAINSNRYACHPSVIETQVIGVSTAEYPRFLLE